MNPTNPLQKYYRQPKIYISLPSKGLYYEEGAFHGDYNNVPIFGMNGMDEIMYKTPDALFTGEATVKVIESCCPFIKDASKMPTLDVDSLVTAIRIATFGELLGIRHTCNNCGTENEFDIDLRTFLEYYSGLTFDNKIQVGELIVTLRPLSYKELTEINIENFKLQKMLAQVSTMTDEQDQQVQVDLVYKNLADVQTQLFINSIDSVQVPDGIVNEKEFIIEAIPCRMIGMNSKLMSQYIEFTADRLMLQLGYDKIYQSSNPFEFMELISIESKVNFFERTNSEYALANKKVDNDIFEMNADF